MEPPQVPPHLTAPIYGIVAHAHIHLNLPGSEYVVLQALALLEGMRADKDTFQFYATTEDLADLTGLSAPAIIKALQRLGQRGAVSRKTASFTPTLFKMNWSKTALTFEQSTYLFDAQQDLQAFLGLSE